MTDPLAKLGSRDAIAALTGVAVVVVAYEGMSHAKALFDHMTGTSLLAQFMEGSSAILKKATDTARDQELSTRKKSTAAQEYWDRTIAGSIVGGVRDRF